MEEVSFDCTKEEIDTIDRIANRVVKMRKSQGIVDNYDKTECMMDLSACHCNGTPLDSDKCGKSYDFALGLDVMGLDKHMNR